MKREDAIKLCRYYHGEKECKLKDPNEQMFWLCERTWVENITRDDVSFFEQYLSDYLQAGLTDFEKFDDTPIVLKALIFNRHCKYSERIDINGFKQLYTKHYCK